MGKSIYFTDKELSYIHLVFSIIDTSESEEEEKVQESISNKVNRARD